MAPAKRILLVGDAPGVRQLLVAVPPGRAVGIVAAWNRPSYHDDLSRSAGELGLPLLVQPRWGSSDYADFLSSVAALAPDLLLCSSYSLLLRDDLLALVAGRAYNVHGGRLPEFRGANPIQWAILAGARETAVTMHELTSEVDAGPIVAERCVPIRFADGWRAVSERIVEATGQLLAETLPSVLAGTATGTPQDDTRARTWPRRTPDDGRIDWSRPVSAIYDLVRALGDGIPPAFYEQDGERFGVDGRLTTAEVAALAFAPGPGGRRFARGGVELLPVGRGLADFRVLRDGTETGTASLLPVDLDRRIARVWTHPDDSQAAELAAAFADDELGFALAS